MSAGVHTRGRGGRVIQRCQKKSQIEDVIRDVSDVTHRKRRLRFEKSQLVEFWRPNEVEIDTWARPDEFVCYGRRT